MAFQRLVRYEHNGDIFYGNMEEANAEGYRVTKLDGTIETGFTAAEQTHFVSKLLCPLEWTPIIQCIGLNYRQHANEANLPVPTYPVVFTKPSDALAGPHDDICVHPKLQNKLDYEGELCVVIGRDAKNVSEADALSYVLGYAIGNDVSARDYQLPETSGGQFCYAKSFDGFAPIGPAIWSTQIVPDPQNLTYVTKVNGEQVQKTSTDDMIWTIKQIISHLSLGTTLRKGTVIMTGTPSGVGFFQNKFLQDGDIVEVEVDGLGKISNKVVFQ